MLFAHRLLISIKANQMCPLPQHPGRKRAGLARGNRISLDQPASPWDIATHPQNWTVGRATLLIHVIEFKPTLNRH
jgi:hypothetical protein